MKYITHNIIASLLLGVLTSPAVLADSVTDNNKAADTTVAIEKDAKEALKDAVVHVYVVKHSYNTLSPWNSNTQKGSGSGLIIKGGLVLTNAHVAADATFIELQRHGETKRHEAEVVYISHEADLALLHQGKRPVQ
ncbi:MAG: serine protease [Thiolinea sp.]